MAYTFPSSFDRSVAQSLGELVRAAYDQLTAFQSNLQWQVPAGYTAVAPSGNVGPLKTKEIWKLPGPLSDVLGGLIPEVPFGFVATKGTDVFVVIRGTITPLEWLDDATAGPVPFRPFNQDWGNVTRGFSMLYKELGIQIIGALNSIRAGGGTIGTIYVTGHSLGGALAQLAAADIAMGLQIKPVTYIFSSPRAGDPAFAAKFASVNLPLWRVFNTEDLVPTLPPAAVEVANVNMGIIHSGPIVDGLIRLVQLSPAGYQHVGYPIAVTFHGNTVADNHSLDTLYKQL